jgi:hypothetical protein
MKNLGRKLLNVIPTEVKIGLGATAFTIASPFLLKGQDMSNVQIKNIDKKIEYQVINIGGIDYRIMPSDTSPCGFVWAYNDDVNPSLNPTTGELREKIYWLPSGELYSENGPTSIEVCDCDPSLKAQKKGPQPCEGAKKKKRKVNLDYPYLEFEGEDKMGYLTLWDQQIDPKTGKITNTPYQGFYKITNETDIDFASENQKAKGIAYTVVNGKFCYIDKPIKVE